VRAFRTDINKVWLDSAFFCYPPKPRTGPGWLVISLMVERHYHGCLVDSTGFASLTVGLILLSPTLCIMGRVYLAVCARRI